MGGIVRRLYRIRLGVIAGSVVLILVGTVAGFVFSDGLLDSVAALLPLVGLFGMLLGFALSLAAATLSPEHGSITVVPPVTGRWLGMNSPATKVPSHGVRVYGQTYAIDLVYEPDAQRRPVFGSGPAMRRSEEYPAFGQPVRAMVDGVVVAVSDSKRDHRARSTSLGVIYMMVEGAIRELGGPGFIIGNSVTIRTAEGVFALVAHLKQGSALVAEGDAVVAGQVIAACGNSGNSSEPHVHAQIMDRASAWTGHGIPFTFAGIRVDDDTESTDTLPGDGQYMTAS